MKTKQYIMIRVVSEMCFSEDTASFLAKKVKSYYDQYILSIKERTDRDGVGRYIT